ncbi:MAG TPA: TIM barrel protein [Longimicrobiales bacterium]
MIDRRTFLAGIGALPGLLACSRARTGVPADSGAGGTLRRIGIQLYSLRDDARRDLAATIAGIAEIGYDDVELLGSFGNFGMAPARMRALLDGNGLRAPSTHVASSALDDLDRTLDDAATIGHEYVTVASLALPERPSLDDYRRWADRFNEAGRRARERGIWIAFHNHAGDQRPIDGTTPYDVFVERTDASVVRHQLDTGNCAMAGHDPLTYVHRFGSRYWTFHIKDVPRLGATSDTELGTGIIDFPRLLAAIDDPDRKHFFVEQETYPGTPFESVRRDFEYMRRLRGARPPDDSAR